MSLDSDIHLLSRVRLFEGFSHEHLRLLAFGAEARMLAQGTEIYREGNLSDGGYVIVSGRIHLTSGLNGQFVSSHSEGSLIGEMALISDVLNPASAVAIDHSEVLKLSRPLFLRMLNEYPELAGLLQKRISKSVQEFIEQLDRIRAKLDHATDLATR